MQFNVVSAAGKQYGTLLGFAYLRTEEHGSLNPSQTVLSVALCLVANIFPRLLRKARRTAGSDTIDVYA